MNNVDGLVVIPPNTRDQSAWEEKIYREASMAQVQHIVKLSTPKAVRHSPCYFFREHALAEEHLRKCGVPFTIVRSISFMQNLLWFAAEVRSKGTLSLPMGDAAVAPVDIRDVARVIAAIAADPINDQDVLNVTGPQSLTFAQMTEELSHAASCHIRYRDIGTRQFTQTLKLSGQSAWHADAILAAWMVARNGQPVITDVVTKITKRQCVTIKTFARECAFHFNDNIPQPPRPTSGNQRLFQRGAVSGDGAQSCLPGTVLRKLEVAGFTLTETTRKTSHLRIHSHENSFFCYLLKGSYSERCGRQKVLFRAPILTYRSAGEPHQVWIHEDVRLFVIEIPPHWIGDLRARSLRFAHSTICSGEYLHSLCAKLHREFYAADTASPLVIEGLILAMLGEASRRRSANNDRPPPLWLRKAQAILAERFTDNLTLAEIAAQVGVHPVTLAAKFRKSYGNTVGEFVRQLRIERARIELSKRNLSLASIAATAGFADQSHFSKAFKSYTGMTPSEYRRELADS